MKTIKSPSKFKYNIHKQIQWFLGYIFRDVNLRSPNNVIRDNLTDIFNKTGGLVSARFDSYTKRINIKVNIPTEYYYQCSTDEKEKKNED